MSNKMSLQRLQNEGTQDGEVFIEIHLVKKFQIQQIHV